MTTDKRQEQGKVIAQVKDAIKRVDEHTYIVNSQSGNGSYNINATELGWNCSCPDHKFRGIKCKHIVCTQKRS